MLFFWLMCGGNGHWRRPGIVNFSNPCSIFSYLSLLNTATKSTYLFDNRLDQNAPKQNEIIDVIVLVNNRCLFWCKLSLNSTLESLALSSYGWYQGCSKILFFIELIKKFCKIMLLNIAALIPPTRVLYSRKSSIPIIYYLSILLLFYFY